MRIYVAGASAEIEDIESIIAKLKAAGHTITHDWTVDVRAAGNNASPDDDEVRVRAALADLRGVVTSDLTWVRQPENASTGSWCELGAAAVMKEGGLPLGRRPLLVVSGPSRKCIFSDLADHRFTRHEDALEFVLSLAKDPGSLDVGSKIRHPEVLAFAGSLELGKLLDDALTLITEGGDEEFMDDVKARLRAARTNQ